MDEEREAAYTLTNGGAGKDIFTTATLPPDLGEQGRGPEIAAGEVSAGVAAAEPLQVPPSLHARFEDFRLLGRGGMGVVYRARDLRLGRSVAIKLLSSPGGPSGGALLREARSQARLRHENACEVFEAGIADHVPFIAMQLIDGEPLSRAKEGMTLEEKVLCVRAIASALHEAHRLGLVHRDVKPGNILVERGERGDCKPYIVDFGIARDMLPGSPELTTGIAGTPTFMAPEQAAGEVRLIDRRTDVYGLGATLYDALAGRPPFEGGSALEVMRKVTDEEPSPLSLHHPGIAPDLAAIAMKCLEKDPAARYASAKALGEDLQRFLDGDPVSARPISWARILWKRARRRKGAVALAAALTAAALILSGLWIRDRSVAARRAELSRELGERVTEMEMFLRTAHGLPLHDMEREREVVRGRLRDIAARMAEAGEIGKGPGHDAIGRGLLALGDPDGALDHFREAERSGYRSPGLDYAMGLSLSALYKGALDAARRIQNEGKKREQLARIEAEYRAPAIARLRAALGHPVAPAAYVEGLIALHEGREDEAVQRAQAAFEAAPWQHEAKKLEGDALFALGSRHRADKAFDHDKAMADFDRAARAYAEAAEVGRSDPSVYTADCELWTQIMNVASEHGAPVRPGFVRARAACERAITASPTSPGAYVKLAWVHNCFAWWAATGRDTGEDPEPVWREAAAHASEAVLRSPEDPMAHYILGAVARTRALDALNRGHTAPELLGPAVSGYEAALRLDPDFAWALNELCSSLAMRGEVESIHGKDPGASFAAAAARCERAIALDPEFAYPLVNRVTIHLYEAEHLLRTGRSPEAPIARAMALLDGVENGRSGQISIPFWRGHLWRARALHAIASGGDVEKPMSEAEAAVGRLEPGFFGKDEAQGLVHLAKAQAALARSGDPAEAIRGARESLARAVEEAPEEVELRIWLAEAHLLAFRRAERGDRKDAAALDAALSALSAVTRPSSARAEPARLDDPRVFVMLAEIHAARAGLWTAERRAAESEIEQGIEQATSALKHSPRSAAALSVLGRLWLLRARAKAPESARKEAASRAAAAFEDAFDANPLLARAEQPLLDEARKLTGEEGRGP